MRFAEKKPSVVNDLILLFSSIACSCLIFLCETKHKSKRWKKPHPIYNHNQPYTNTRLNYSMFFRRPKYLNFTETDSSSPPPPPIGCFFPYFGMCVRVCDFRERVRVFCKQGQSLIFRAIYIHDNNSTKIIITSSGPSCVCARVYLCGCLRLASSRHVII